MTEDFLQFIWKYGLFDRDTMIADTGEAIQVIGLGEHNTDAGPDFLNTRIKIGNTTWAGNVEIHLKSADWLIHKHQHDKAYENVILHVVVQHNHPVQRHNGEIIPTVELHFDSGLYENYCTLMSQKAGLPCKDKIGKVDPLIIDLWLNSLVVDRLQQKTGHISELLDQYRNNWEEVFFISLARSFGFGLNAIPFEMLAKSVSLSCLAKHRNSPKQLEALLMGQAGLLDEGNIFEAYYMELRKEYLHLKNKYNLKSIEKHLWKFLRLRPVNFPFIRIAQFSAVLQHAEGLFSRVLACKEFVELRQLFDMKTSDYWDTHYTFETPSPLLVKRFGTDAFHIIVINTVIPFLFLYGRLNGQEELKERALEWLSRLPAEKNRITNRWALDVSAPSNALYSQGILQLSNSYCIRKRCLSCSIGSYIITKGL
jgi:hypothetical protein